MKMLHKPDDIIAERYRIATPLGRGAMCTTYEAEDSIDHQRVALKVLSLRHVTDWKILELFEREAKVLSSISHPSIPKYLDYFHLDTPEDRRFYLVRELVDGESLADLIDKAWHPSVDEVKQIAIQLLKSLSYLHSLRPPVIHRDIKPQNIIRRRDSKVFLVDFGAVQDVYRNTLTRGGTFVGTLGYMPQEQLRGQALPASDLYAVGATLLFLLAGESPENLPQRRLKIDFRSRVIIEEDFAGWLEKMLEPLAEERFQSATEALDALRATGNYLVSKRKQPIGSKVKLYKTNQRLIIHIPKASSSSWIYSGEFTWFFSLLMMTTQFFWLISIHYSPTSLKGIIVYHILGILPCAIAIFFCLKVVMLKHYASNYIEIDRETFRLARKAFIFSSQVKGRTADIHHVKLNRKKLTNNTYFLIPRLKLNHKKYEFGIGLTEEEKQWLIEEITDFLG